MKRYHQYTLNEYLDALASRTPVPGGGSAAALTAACAAALISMVAGYSLNRGSPRRTEERIKKTLQKSEKIRKRLLILVDLDSRAYLRVVASRKSSSVRKKAALVQAAKVPAEVCRLCYEAVGLTSYLFSHGNKNLVSDVEVAVELFLAAFKSAMVNVKINQL